MRPMWRPIRIPEDTSALDHPSKLTRRVNLRWRPGTCRMARPRTPWRRRCLWRSTTTPSPALPSSTWRMTTHSAWRQVRATFLAHASSCTLYMSKSLRSAVAGTAKQHVADDYAQRVAAGARATMLLRRRAVCNTHADAHKEVPAMNAAAMSRLHKGRWDFARELLGWGSRRVGAADYVDNIIKASAANFLNVATAAAPAITRRFRLHRSRRRDGRVRLPALSRALPLLLQGSRRRSESWSGRWRACCSNGGSSRPHSMQQQRGTRPGLCGGRRQRWGWRAGAQPASAAMQQQPPLLPRQGNNSRQGPTQAWTERWQQAVRQQL